MQAAKTLESFDDLYAKLNPRQREAVDAIEGPVMVIAGPGTGKTQILTLRIANIIKKTDTAPEQILALTFTETGVHAMRRRLVEMIGAPGYKVGIDTFHGFANDVIARYPEEFPNIIGAEHVTEVEQIKEIEGIVERLSLKELKPFGNPFYYLRDILIAINKLKREGIHPDAFKEIIKKELSAFEDIPDLYHAKGPWKGKMKGDYVSLQKRLKKNEELGLVYLAYEDGLCAAHHYDYGDMIVETIGALRSNTDLLRTLQEQYQYVLVDEHQDTNNAQNAILELLANFHSLPNLFVVGDEKQAIFRFQGASLENFLYFKNLYPTAQLIVLEDNYRSTQSILDSAHGVLAGEKKLQAHAGHAETPIRCFAFSRPDVESYFIARDIKEKIAGGVAPEEIAVLYRDNRDAFPIATMLEKIGVPFGIESDQDIMTDPDMRKFITLLRAVSDVGDDAAIAAALHIDFLRCDPLDIYTVIRYAGKEHVPILRAMGSLETLGALGIEKKAQMHELGKHLRAWGTAAKNDPLLELVERVIRESSFLAHLLGLPDALEKMEKINALFAEMQQLAENHATYSLGDFLAYLETLTAHRLLIKKVVGAGGGRRVHLMTAHRSKGQEFEYVYIVNASDGHWGGRTRRENIKIPAVVFSRTGNAIPEAHDDDDETRLFYVALTRAKKEVTITYAKQSVSGDEQLPSQFIQSIHKDLVKNISSDAYEVDYAADHVLRFAPRTILGPSIKEKSFLAGVFDEKGLSVSGLNHFLECPWNYFYNDVLHVPRAKTRPELYGIAVHAAVKDFFDKLRVGETPDKAFLLARFALYMKRAALSEQELDESFVKGDRALSGYYDAYAGSWHVNTLTEFAVSGGALDGGAGGGAHAPIKLTGKIDKMNLLDAGGVVVVDYKTGKPKTRGQMEGKTKDGAGNEKRQLVFYDILLRGYDGGKFKMISGDIDFLEPDDKGRYHRENFVVTEDDRATLTGLIQKTAGQIREFSFRNERCGEKDCQFCALREMMG